MDANKLDRDLDIVCENFKDAVKTEINNSECSKETNDLVEEIARQAYYAFAEFKNVLKNYAE